MEPLERYGISPAVAWVATLLTGVAGVAVAAILFPVRVYRGVIWRYFLGPVHADALGANCIVYSTEHGELLVDPADGCGSVAGQTAFLAEPGYTVTSTFGYIVVLVFMLAGVYLLLKRFDLHPPRYLFFALVPFMLFGGALRTVEDSFVAALRAGTTPPLEYPLSALLISPFIYFTVFAIALGAFLGSKWLARTGRTDTYYYPLGITGAVVLVGTVGYLTTLGLVTDYVGFHPSILAIVLGLATALAVGTYKVVDWNWPAVHRGTGRVGLVVIWGHAVDGLANVLASDWTWVWGVGQYSPKHPLNEFIITTTASIQGSGLTSTIGSAWPFLVLKLVVPVLILAVFDKEFIDESPYYAVMLLIAIVAVGLGPGTRDMLRVAFGI